MKHYIKSLPVRRISPGRENFFFGYYDLQPQSEDGNLYLAHHTAFRNRLQVRGDSAAVGVIDMRTGNYEVLDTTCAWNFQQGAMLQWNPMKPNREVIYNTLDDGEQRGVVLDIYSGKKRLLERPVANVSKDGRFGLSINMSRLYNFRPGYGYAWPADPFYYAKHDRADGVYLTDMETGKAKLVLSLEEIWDFSGGFFGKEEKILINHITFNPDGSRFLALVRNFAPKGVRHDTAIITANRDGSDLYLLSNYGVQSHYWWLDNEQVIFYAGGAELDCSRGWANNYILKDKTHEGRIQAEGYFVDDNHMSFTPDQRLMVTDSYPDGNGNQVITFYHPEKNTAVDVGWFHSMENVCTDVRCDLHPRWSRKGDFITFDSTHEGFRGIYQIELPEDVEGFFEGKR